MFNVNQHYCNFIVKYLELEEKNISSTSLTKYINHSVHILQQNPVHIFSLYVKYC